MAEHRFSKQEAIRFGWEKVTGNIWFFVKLTLLAMFAMWFVGFLAGSIADSIPALSLLMKLIGFVFNGWIFMGMAKIALAFVDQEPVRIADLFSCYRQIVPYVVASFLYALIILAGCLLLIVPGIIWGIKYMFYQFSIVDKNSGPVVALKESAAITKGVKWDLFLFSLLILGIVLLGVLAFVVGLVIAIPVTVLASAYVYRKLLSAASQAGQAEAGPKLPDIVSSAR